MPPRKKTEVVEDRNNDALPDIEVTAPMVVSFTLEGVSALLFHRWSNEAVAEKAAAAKNSVAKKTDNIESYVYRTPEGELALPGEYVRGSMVNASRYRQDPRSPRKSAMDMFKAGIVNLTDLASFGVSDWDFLDARRVQVQRSAVTRQRPAMNAGWTLDFQFVINLPEYIDHRMFYSVLADAGRLVGIGDFRPTYGRFIIKNFAIDS